MTLLFVVLAWIVGLAAILVLATLSIRKHRDKLNGDLVPEIEEFLKLEGAWNLPPV